MGLIEAANKYDPTVNNLFRTFAKFRIRGAILDSLRKLDWASRDDRHHQKIVDTAIRELVTTLGRIPNEIEVAVKSGLELRVCRHAMTQLHNGEPLSLSTHDGAIFPDHTCDREEHPDFIYGRAELRGTLGEAMKGLPVRYKQVIEMYYEKQMTMKEISGILGVNESRVSQIHTAALAEMHTVLQNNGIKSMAAFV